MFTRTIGSHVSNSQEIKNMLDFINLPDLTTEAESAYSNQMLSRIKDLYNANQLSAQDAIEIQICHITTLINKLRTQKKEIFKRIENKNFNKSTQSKDIFLNYLFYSTTILTGFCGIHYSINSPWKYPSEDLTNGVCSTNNPEREVRNPITLGILIFQINIFFLMRVRRFKMHDYSNEIENIQNKVNYDLIQENKNNSKIYYIKKLILEANNRYKLDLSERTLDLNLNNTNGSPVVTFEMICKAKIKVDKILNQLTHQQEKMQNLLKIELQRQQKNPAVQSNELQKEIQILMHKFLNDSLITSPENIKLIMNNQLNTNQVSRSAIKQDPVKSNNLNSMLIPQVKINKNQQKTLFKIIPELILSPKENRHQFIDLYQSHDKAKFLIAISDNINELLQDIKKSKKQNNTVKSLQTRNLEGPKDIECISTLMFLLLPTWALIETYWFLISFSIVADKTQTTPGPVGDRYIKHISLWDDDHLESWCKGDQLHSQTPLNKCCKKEYAFAYRDLVLAGTIITMIVTPCILVGLVNLYGYLDSYCVEDNTQMLPKNSQILNIKLHFTENQLNKIKDLANILLNSKQIDNLTQENIDQAIKIIEQNKLKYINFCKNKNISLFDFRSEQIDEKHSKIMSGLFENHIETPSAPAPSAPYIGDFSSQQNDEIAIQINDQDGESYSLTNNSNGKNGTSSSKSNQSKSSNSFLSIAGNRVNRENNKYHNLSNNNQLTRPDDRQNI